MSERNPKGCLLAALIWLVILGVLAVAAKFFLLPALQERHERKEEGYKHKIRLAADSFSGYCILRSAAMAYELRAQGIKLVVEDDKADYEARMKALRARQFEMAVFTVDSLVLTGAKLGEFPAVIVAVIDESNGADAIVAYKSAVGSLQDLDHPDGRFVLTPQSPSEFLARIVKADFHLPRLPEKWWIAAEGASDVFRQFRAADKTAKRAYVLWEPYVSKALEIPDAHVLLDSAKIKGYILDVLAAERTFLAENPALVRAVVEAYFRVAYVWAQKSDGMKSMVMADAQKTGTESLTDAQAAKLVQGIEWKNTLENYAYFGLQGTPAAGGPPPIQESIANIARVLVQTGALPADAILGREHTLFSDQVLKTLLASKFHPGRLANVLKGPGLESLPAESVRTRGPLRALSDAEWESLRAVGQIKVEDISFARGSARLSEEGQRRLDELARKLSAWPEYYLVVEGNARAEGDPEANLQLAQARAKAAADYLIARGVAPTRIRARAVPPSLKEGAAQSVSFVLKQLPY